MCRKNTVWKETREIQHQDAFTAAARRGNGKEPCRECRANHFAGVEIHCQGTWTTYSNLAGVNLGVEITNSMFFFPLNPSLAPLCQNPTENKRARKPTDKAHIGPPSRAQRWMENRRHSEQTNTGFREWSLEKPTAKSLFHNNKFCEKDESSQGEFFLPLPVSPSK